MNDNGIIPRLERLEAKVERLDSRLDKHIDNVHSIFETILRILGEAKSDTLPRGGAKKIVQLSEVLRQRQRDKSNPEN